MTASFNINIIRHIKVMNASIHLTMLLNLNEFNTCRSKALERAGSNRKIYRRMSLHLSIIKLASYPEDRNAILLGSEKFICELDVSLGC